VELIARILFWSLFAVVIACVEIEAEGKHGWAEKMPTWYRTTGFWARLYGIVMARKPLTGYHLFMFFFPILLFHAPFVMGVEWTSSKEYLAWALYLAWGPLWDYFWFVLNPHYAGKFHPNHVWWHATSNWVGGRFPHDYLFALIFSLVLATRAAKVGGSWTILTDHLGLLCGFGFMTLLLHLAAPAYHRWYWRMRLHDDRDKVDIYHRDAS